MRERIDVAKLSSSIVALGVLIVGVPLALVAASRARFGSPNPLAGVDPPWRWFNDGSSLSQQIPDDTVIDALIRLSVCVIWLAVGVIAITTVLEIAHMIRHRGLPMPSVRGIGWAQQIGRFIAVGLIVAIPVTTSTPSIAGSLPASAGTSDAPITQRHTIDHGIATTDVADVAATTPPSTHVVGPGESIYSIAERLAASNGRTVIEIAASIVDANLGQPVGPAQRFTNPAYLEVGWTLQIPASLAAAPADVRPSVAATYVVEPGDTLWDIADEQLGDATEWPTIWADNAGDDMGGGRTFDDPDLILPGWELDLPGASDEPIVVAEARVAPDTIPTSTADTAPIGPEPAPADPAIPAADATTPTAPPIGVIPITVGAEDASTTTTPATTTTTTTTTTTAAVDGGQGGSVDDTPLPAPQAPSPLRIEHAALLAAGVLALVAVRRRQRLRAARPRHRVPEPRRDVVETERRLRAIDAGERAMRVDVACRAAAWSLIGTGVQIGWVVATTDGDVGLRLTGPARLPAPWTGAGADWWLAADVPVELLSDDARRVGMPCVALVQLGVTPQGAEVLVDLEACATLAIDARPDQADEVLAALAAGLASSIYAEVAHLIGVSMSRAAFLGHRNAHVAATAAEAFELATSLVGSTLDNDRTAFELRSLRTGGEMWEPAVVLFGVGEHGVRPVLHGGHGLGVVVAVARGELADAPTRLIGMADSWCLVGFGSEIELTPIGLTVADLTAIDDVLADADRALRSIELDDVRWADTAGESVTGASDQPDDSSTGDTRHDEPSTHETEPQPFVPMEHRIVVRLIGAVEVADNSGTSGSFERSKTVELIAWLATHRERATRTGARTALWELDVRDATFANVVSEARRGLARLVAPPEGEEWVARTLTEQLPLHEAVVTDADLVTERLAHARLQPPTQALHTLRPAVEMIRGMPFAGTSYLWPDAEGITSNLVLLTITAAAEYAGHALSLGDTDGVFWATGRGLQVLAGHEELIGLRMRAHSRAGDLAGVRQEWESYERVLVADAWSDGEPAPKLLALRRELLSPTNP